MKSPNGYTAEMVHVKHKKSQYGCGSRPGRNGGELPQMGFVQEACYFDGFWNCNLFPGCELCELEGPNTCRTPPAVGRYLDIAANSTEADTGGTPFVA